jgi:pimeloyl-ACP methyl ester carboxylesterase
MKLFFSLALLVSSLSSFAETPFKGYVKVAEGYEIYADYTPAVAGQPTVVLVNGLVYNLHRWDAYVNELKKSGTGIVRYYFRGQSLSLLQESAHGKKTPEFFATGLSYPKMALELSAVLEALKIEGKVNVVGLSYGASIAAEFANSFPERVDNLILMAPLVVSLDRYDPTGAWIHESLDAIRFWWGPLWGPQAYDFYYNMIYHSYLVDERITQDRVPPELASIPDVYKESIFHLVRAVRDFDLKSYDFSKVARVHLLVASDEDAPALADQYSSWQAWAEQSKGSLTYIDHSSHAIPDSVPALAAELTGKMIAGEKDYQNGSIYLAGEDSGIKRCANLSDLKNKKCN